MNGLMAGITTVDSTVTASSFTADPGLYLGDVWQQAWQNGARDIDLIVAGDQFKRDRRTLVLLSPAVTLPPELAQDVVMLDEPLPTVGQLMLMTKGLYKALGTQEPEKGRCRRP